MISQQEGAVSSLQLKGALSVDLPDGSTFKIEVFSSAKTAKQFLGDYKSEFQAVGKGGGAKLVGGTTVLSYPTNLASSNLKKAQSCAS